MDRTKVEGEFSHAFCENSQRRNYAIVQTQNEKLIDYNEKRDRGRQADRQTIKV